MRELTDTDETHNGRCEVLVIHPDDVVGADSGTATFSAWCLGEHNRGSPVFSEATPTVAAPSRATPITGKGSTRSRSTPAEGPAVPWGRWSRPTLKPNRAISVASTRSTTRWALEPSRLNALQRSSRTGSVGGREARSHPRGWVDQADPGAADLAMAQITSAAARDLAAGFVLWEPAHFTAI